MKQSNLVIIGVVVVVAAVIGLMMMSAPKTQTMPEADTTTAQDQNLEITQPAMNTKNIVEIASEAGTFNTLVAAVKAAGLVETLSGPGPFTVFAPTDEAFAKLPPGTVESLLQDKEKLTQILTYHVVSGKVMAKDVVNLTSAKTVQGDDVMIRAEGGKVMLNESTVVTTDIEASNGVIHVIDTVLIPQE